MKSDKTQYPFMAEKEMIAQGKVLAADYGISLNQVLTRLLNEALQEWSVPGMEQRPHPTIRDTTKDQEKSLT